MSAPDPSSPSTSSARDAVRDAFAYAMQEHATARGWCLACHKTGLDEKHPYEMALDAALGVTYTPLCPECEEGFQRFGAADGLAHLVRCLACNGSRRSAPRLALIDVLAVPACHDRTNRDGELLRNLCDNCGEYEWDEAVYCIPSSKES